MPDWDRVYQEKSIDNACAAEVLINNLRLLPVQGRALDYACGLAANAAVLAERGFAVEAWDFSEVAVSKVNEHAKKHSLQISAQQIDLENSPPDIKSKFDVIIVSYFLHRETLPDLYNYLNKDGLLFYETFSGKQLAGNGPSRDAFRLQRGELLKVFSDMELLYYREDMYQADQPDNKSDQVCFVAKK